MKKTVMSSALVLLFSGLILLPTRSLQAADGQEILLARCTICHSAKRIGKAEHTPEGWEKTVDRMMSKRGFGEKLSDEDRQTLLAHLGEMKK